ncbi:MAG: helix-turn-helix transcriptional regulator [Actinomycetota bacterium]|nr:helix-turn-helix transcriptional regulator [Actinomycetota bacterium]
MKPPPLSVILVGTHMMVPVRATVKGGSHTVPNEVFPERLREARQRAGLTLAGLAAATGMQSRQVAGRWEEGIRMPDAATLVAISRTLGVSADFLLGLDSDVGNSSPRTLELAEAISSNSHVTWSGRTLRPQERVRAWAILHALLSPVEEIGYPQETNKDKPEQKEKPTRLRAREVFASGSAERPRPQAGADRSGSVGEGNEHGTA